MIETEKKYKLDKRQFNKLNTILGHPIKYSKEENIIYSGNNLRTSEVLRIRKLSDGYGVREYIVAYKGKATSSDGIKSREEIEFSLGNSNIENFIVALGYFPVLVYEKKRKDWTQDNCIISLDELPFGYYMEIEGTKESIQKIEHRFKDRFGMILDTENFSYPDLTQIYGKSVNGVMEARF